MKQTNRRLWELWGQTNALYTQWCSRSDVNYYRQLVLYALDSHEPVTQRQISDHTGLSRQTVATVMRALKTEDVVALSSANKDRREKYVRLTEEGKRYADKTLHGLYELESRVFEMMGKERVKQMLDAVSLFNTVFEKELENMQDEQQK